MANKTNLIKRILSQVIWKSFKPEKYIIMTAMELEHQLKLTDKLQKIKALGPDITDFYYQSRKENLKAVYEMSKHPISIEQAKWQTDRSLGLV